MSVVSLYNCRYSSFLEVNYGKIDYIWNKKVNEVVKPKVVAPKPKIKAKKVEVEVEKPKTKFFFTDDELKNNKIRFIPTQTDLKRTINRVINVELDKDRDEPVPPIGKTKPEWEQVWGDELNKYVK